METATALPDLPDDDVRMGSEYATARVYLARPPRAVSKSKHEPRKPSTGDATHGSNDSDFGVPPDVDD